MIAPEPTGHPVGGSYSAASTRPELKLRPSAMLPASVRLEDGRIGCSSCHDLMSPLPARLAMSNHGSALCFACHEM
ncbi:MAG: hypothetical protein HYU51_06320 [Candidatus Rokubacteria bacterium]|nr:hypothetical protein [Candidatus Rokubacteria bacterium]